MIFWAIKHGKHLSKFSYNAISINQLIELHRLGYTFEPASNNLMLLANQAGSIPPVRATQQGKQQGKHQ